MFVFFGGAGGGWVVWGGGMGGGRGVGGGGAGGQRQHVHHAVAAKKAKSPGVLAAGFWAWWESGNMCNFL